MQLIAPGKGWALGPNAQLFWTNDNGAHWSNISPKFTSVMTDVFFLDVSHGWVLLTSEDEEKNLVSFVVASTSDSGRTWTFLPMAVPSQKPDELDGRAWLDFVDPQHGWVVVHPKTSSAFSWALLMATEDGGTTWKELPQAPVRARPVFVTAKDGWISGGSYEGGVYRTRDGGKTWEGGGPSPEDSSQSLPTQANYGDVKFTDAKHGTLLAWLSPATDAENSRGNALVLYITDDGGNTWKRDRVWNDYSKFSRIGPACVAPSFAGTESVLIAAFVDYPKHELALKSVTREGKTASVNSVFPLREHEIPSQLDFVGGNDGWAFTNSGRLLSTTDGGSTWKDISPIPLAPLPTGPEATKHSKVKARLLGPGPKLVPESSAPALHYVQRLGFDEQNVPPIDVMGTWWDTSPFFDIGIYVGGANYCGVHNSNGTCKSRPDPGLIVSWVNQAQGQGWDFFPLWVGPQAPCVIAPAGTYVTFTSANATSQGTSNADSASVAMAALGLSGTVVFYDMENYNITDSACSQAVRAFLTAWVKEMNADGFQTTAVYGNPGPAQNDFSQVPGLTQVWIAAAAAPKQPPRVTIWGLGSGSNALSDSHFNLGQRAHQFLIDVVGTPPNSWVTYGGKNTGHKIDYDVVDLGLPGGDGTKQYVWTMSNVNASSQFPNASIVSLPALNDIFVGTSGPTFISAGQLGQIAGYWDYDPIGNVPCGDMGCSYPFLYQSASYKSFSDPSGPNATVPFGINSAGQVAGLYCNGSLPDPSGVNYVECDNYNAQGDWLSTAQQGFLGTPTAGTYTSITEGATQYYTWATGVNDDQQAVGYYIDHSTGQVTNFLYRNGNFLQLYISTDDCPGQAGVIYVLGINGSSQIVGVCESTSYSAFIFDPQSDGTGYLIPITPPGSTSTFLWGINNQGQLLGNYTDSNGTHTFILDNGHYYLLPGTEIYYSGPGYLGPNGGFNDAAQVVGHQLDNCQQCFTVLNPE
jgi:photosystem II stability/assembly factor-like uncharacterized protein